MDYEAAPLEVDSWVRKEEVRHFGTLFQSIWIQKMVILYLISDQIMFLEMRLSLRLKIHTGEYLLEL